MIRTLIAFACAASLLLTTCVSGADPMPTPDGAAQLRTPGMVASGQSWLGRAVIGQTAVQAAARALTVGGLIAYASRPFENPRRMAGALDGRLLEAPTDVGNAYGSGVALASGALGVLALGRLTGNATLEDTGDDLCRSLVASGAAVWSLKFAFDRTRPNGGQHSFPSGHTAAAFCVAPVIRKHFGLKAAIPAYALAVSTGLGRMEDNKHYLSDVIFGAFLGLTVGEWVAGREDGGRLGESVSVDGSRVGLTYHF